MQLLMGLTQQGKVQDQYHLCLPFDVINRLKDNKNSTSVLYEYVASRLTYASSICCSYGEHLFRSHTCVEAIVCS